MSWAAFFAGTAIGGLVGVAIGLVGGIYLVTGALSLKRLEDAE